MEFGDVSGDLHNIPENKRTLTLSDRIDHRWSIAVILGRIFVLKVL